MQQTLTVAGTEVLIDGPQATDDAAAPCIVMLHGWPDTARLWDGSVAALAPHYRCVRFTWPGFGPAGPGQPADAPSLDSLVGLLHQVVLRCAGGRPVTLLLHDWGCLFGYHYARLHPQQVARIAAVDIGDAGSREHRAELTVRQTLAVLGYQLWLAAAWRIGGSLGDRMARWMARLLRVPLAPSAITARAGHPYWSTWTGRYRAMRTYRGELPTWFAYGQRKPFMFHSAAWRDALAARQGCRVLGLRAGHWVMLDAAAPFHESLLQWLREVPAGVPAGGQDAGPAAPASGAARTT